MLKYRWVCHLCDEANAATNNACVKCGFPAIASRLDMDRANEHAQFTVLQSPPTAAPIPLPKKIVGGFALGILLLGALLAKFAYPIWLNIAGLVLTGLGALVLWALGFFGEDKHA